MKSKLNITLTIIAIFALFLLFFPMADWNRFMEVLLRVVPAFCIQWVFCRKFRSKLLKILPILLTGLAFLWGVYMAFVQNPDWGSLPWTYLILYYGSPAIGSVAGLLVHKFTFKA